MGTATAVAGISKCRTGLIMTTEVVHGVDVISSCIYAVSVRYHDFCVGFLACVRRRVRTILNVSITCVLAVYDCKNEKNSAILAVFL